MLNTTTLLPQETRGSLGSSRKLPLASTMPSAAPSKLFLSPQQRQISCFVSKNKSRNGARLSKPIPSQPSSIGAVKQNAAPSSSESTTHPTDLEDLVRRRYFDDLFTGGDFTLASKILDPGVIHRDMVRDEQYSGVEEVIEFMREIKGTYPSFSVHATEIAMSPDENSMFVTFEGHAAEGMPLFRGIDRIFFTSVDGESGGVEKKIKEIDVYRSNWQGAKGHSQRKVDREEQLRKEEREVEENRRHKKH